MKKKVRVRKAAEDEGAGLDLAALEAEAAAAGKSELGSRKQAAGREAQAKEAQVADEAHRQSKYDSARQCKSKADTAPQVLLSLIFVPCCAVHHVHKTECTE